MVGINYQAHLVRNWIFQTVLMGSETMLLFTHDLQSKTHRCFTKTLHARNKSRYMKERQETCEVTNLHINLPKNQQQKSLNIWPKPKSRRECLSTTVCHRLFVGFMQSKYSYIGRSSCNRVVITVSGRFARSDNIETVQGWYVIHNFKQSCCGRSLMIHQVHV